MFPRYEAINVARIKNVLRLDFNQNDRVYFINSNRTLLIKKQKKVKTYETIDFDFF